MKKNRGVIDWLTVIACIAIAVAAWAAYRWVYAKGFEARAAIAQQDDAQRAKADATEKARQETAGRQADTALRDEAAQLRTQLQESQDHANTLQTNLDRALRTGDKRLSIRTTSCQPARLPADRAAQPAAPGPQEARAELHPADAADIAAITAEADNAARELNHCIDSYTSAATTLERYKQNLKGQAHVEAAQPAQSH